MNAAALSTALMLGCFVLPDPAQGDPERLGRELTPVGAERAGNADGSIPEWAGGIHRPVPGYRPGERHRDPYPGDEPLFEITADNVAQFEELLSPGYLALFRAYPETWRMPVYPTRRSAAYPEFYYAETKRNATRARLTRSGNGVVDARAGVPFPLPESGLEVIWNHLLRYRGRELTWTYDVVAPTRAGRHTAVTFLEDLLFVYNNLELPEQLLAEQRRSLFFRLQTIAPAAISGDIALVHESRDHDSIPRSSWIYVRGERRVRRVQLMVNDASWPGRDGLETMDDFDMFNGTPATYHWTLHGKRELFIPYNSYRLHAGKVTRADMLRPGHVNPALTRYERHRVWMIEGRLKEGERHSYHRRVYYLDEDTWQIALGELYDADGGIWRVRLNFPINYYEVPVHFMTIEVGHDLALGRYVVTGIDNHLPPPDFQPSLSPHDFTPNALRRLGVR